MRALTLFAALQQYPQAAQMRVQTDFYSPKIRRKMGEVLPLLKFFLGRVDKRDSQGALIVIQAGLCDGDQLGTRFDVGRGMGFSRALHSGRPSAEWAQTYRPSGRS